MDPSGAAPATGATNGGRHLQRGDQLPSGRFDSPAQATALALQSLARYEAPVVNTLDPSGLAKPIVWQEALGANVLDLDGNIYVDCTSGFGVASIGHRHPRLVRAVERQLGQLVHGLGDVAAHPSRIALAERLCALAPVDEPRVHFAASGSDAVEIALKAALLATGRQAVIAFDGGYHGLTLGALATTSRVEFREPFESRLQPFVIRAPFGGPLVRLREDMEGAGAVIVEPILGREGVVLPPDGWLSGLAELARASGCLLMVDEIYTGFGKTGEWFAVHAEGVRPDILLVGKALGGGLPIAAAIASAPVFSAWNRTGEALHTATFLAHPLACAAALETLAILEDEDLVTRAGRLGGIFAARAGVWKDSPGVVATRGRGALWAVEFADSGAAAATQKALFRAGILTLRGGPRASVIQLAPPLVISESQLTHVLDNLEAALVERAGAP